MATNKNAQLRYNILDECFANPYKKFFIEDLIAICSEKLSEYYGEEKTVSRRTILEDIVFMESADGFNAPIERIKEGKRVYFRYEEPNFSILKKELNTSDKEILTEMLSLFARLKNIENFEWVENLKTKIQSVIDINFQQQIIDFQDNNFLAGLEYLNPLYHYIANQQSLSIIYKPFTENTKIVVISPYYLKQYNNRSFKYDRILKSPKKGDVLNVRLDIFDEAKKAYKLLTAQKGNVSDCKAIKMVEGELKITSSGVGFIGDIFVLKNLIERNQWKNNQIIKTKAFLSFDKKKDKWGWAVI